MDGPDARGSATLFRFGAAEFDESRFELSVGGRTVDLEQKPLRVLAVLLHHRGEVVSRHELLEVVWAGRVTVEQVLSNAVMKLRKALGVDDAQRIVTVPRTGYRFDGAVERIGVGTSLASWQDFKVGDVVPGRGHFVLLSRLASSAGSEVWLARHRKSGEARVYKFARDAERLGALKREVTLYRVLREALGERDERRWSGELCHQCLHGQLQHFGRPQLYDSGEIHQQGQPRRGERKYLRHRRLAHQLLGYDLDRRRLQRCRYI